MSEATVAEAPAKKDEYIVQTKQVVESWDYPTMKTGRTRPDGSDEIAIVPKSAPVKTTKIISGQFGPFTSRATAEVLCQQLGLNGNAFSAQVFTLTDEPAAPAGSDQVAPSEDVLKQMIKDGKLPGVSPDAEVKTEGEVPDNTVPFPSKPQPE